VAELDLLPKPESPSPASDWAIRVSIAVPYFLIGLGQLSSSPDSHWVAVSEQSHAGQWFRYFTGVVESSVAPLVLIPVLLLLLASTVLCASLIVAFVLQQPGKLRSLDSCF
jgi:hypothetical protein